MATRTSSAAASSGDKHRFWRGHIEGWQRSGVSQRDYCGQAGVSLSTFTLWRRRLATTQSRLTPIGIVDLVPVPKLVSSVPTPIVRATASPVVVVLAQGQYRLEVTKGFDAETLRAVVGALESKS